MVRAPLSVLPKRLTMPLVGLDLHVLRHLYSGAGRVWRSLWRWVPALLVAGFGVASIGRLLADPIVGGDEFRRIEAASLFGFLALTVVSVLVWVAKARKRVTITPFERYRARPATQEAADLKAEKPGDDGISNLVALGLLRLNEVFSSVNRLTRETNDD